VEAIEDRSLVAVAEIEPLIVFGGPSYNHTSWMKLADTVLKMKQQTSECRINFIYKESTDTFPIEGVIG
jgi:hypothetical protein